MKKVAENPDLPKWNGYANTSCGVSSRLCPFLTFAAKILVMFVVFSKSETFTGAKAPSSECSTGTKVIFGLFAPGNESARERKVQIPFSKDRQKA